MNRIKGRFIKGHTENNGKGLGFKFGHPFYKGGEKGWFKKGIVPFIKGKKHTQDTLSKIKLFKKGQTPWNKGIKMPEISGINHPKWKNGISKTKQYKRFYDKLSCAKRKLGGKLKSQTLQLVYEDNIKKYGTLTCYLCLKPIPFGKDHLEHKIPLSRGGTNEYNNLSISCQKCNLKKYNRTEEEFMKLIK